MVKHAEPIPKKAKPKTVGVMEASRPKNGEFEIKKTEKAVVIVPKKSTNLLYIN